MAAPEGTLDEDIVVLLREAKHVPELSAETKARLLAEIGSRVALVPDGGSEGGNGPPGGAAAESPGASHATRVDAVRGTASGGFSLTGARAVVALVGTFAVGLSAGMVVDRSLSAPSASLPPPSIAPAMSSARSEPPRAEASSVPVTELPSAPSAPRRAASPPPRTVEPGVTSSPSAQGLAAERALLDVARGALARGEAQEALDATQRHSGQYSSGALVEEREAIAIKALVALGRREEALARVAEMERRFPHSLLLGAVRAAVSP